MHICILHGIVVYPQERIAKAHGSQCGFCTPGIVMSMYTLLRNNTMPTEEEMEKAFEGNYQLHCDCDCVCVCVRVRVCMCESVYTRIFMYV